jgi:hypothetical protein
LQGGTQKLTADCADCFSFSVALGDGVNIVLEDIHAADSATGNEQSV